MRFDEQYFDCDSPHPVSPDTTTTRLLRIVWTMCSLRDKRERGRTDSRRRGRKDRRMEGKMENREERVETEGEEGRTRAMRFR
jgi:hypothetical protein